MYYKSYPILKSPLRS